MPRCEDASIDQATIKFGIPNRIPPDMGRYFSDTDRGIYCQKIRYTEKGVEEEEEEEEQ